MAPQEKTVVSLLNGSRRPGVVFPPELLQRMDLLYAFTTNNGGVIAKC